jgi:cobalt/nickel transport system permease protein
MHISEGILAAPVLIGGGALSAAGATIGLRRIHDEQIPKVAVMGSAFFVASLIHVPVGAGSAHLVLNGLAGLLLGWAAFPAILIGLALQAFFFGFGGITALGVNTFTMAAPAVACYCLLNRRLLTCRTESAFVLGFAAGAGSIALATALTATALLLSGGNYTRMAAFLGVAHIGVMVVEGMVTGAVVAFLKKTRPELLNTPAVVKHGTVEAKTS